MLSIRRPMILLLAAAVLSPGCGGNPRSVDGKKPEAFIADLEGADQKAREQAKKALALMGRNSVEALSGYLARADAAGKVDAANLLTKIGQDAGKAAPALLDALSHEDERVRNAAKSALANIGADSVKGLCGLVGGNDPALRMMALEILTDIGPKAKDCIAQVTGLLSSDDAGIRAAAVKTLGRVGPADSETVETVIKAAADADPGVRKNAAFALGQARASKDKAIAALLKLTADPEKDVRVTSIESLGRFGKAASPARERVVALAKDPSGEARGQAIISAVTLDLPASEAILLLVDSMASCPEGEKMRLAEKIASFAVAGTVKVDRVLIDAMKWIGSLFLDDPKKAETARVIVVKLGAKAIPHLTTMLACKNADLKRAAASLLGDIREGAEHAIDDLTRLLDDPEVPVRAAAAETLGKIGPTARPAIGKLIEKAADPDKSVRSASIAALALLGPRPEQALPVLSKSLADPEAEVSERAAMAIAALGSDAAPAREALEAALVHKDGVRWPVLVALGEIGAMESAAVPALAAALSGSEGAARRDAAKALGVLGEKASSAAEQLTSALSDPDGEVRASACFALGRLGQAGRTRVKALEGRLSDEDPVVRLRAVEALLALGAAPPESVQAVLGVLEIAVRNIETGKNLNILIWSSDMISKLGGKSDSVVGLLADALKSGRFKRSPPVVIKILETMRILGPAEKSAIPALAWLIENDEDEEVFVKAAEYAGTFGAEGIAALDGLVEYGLQLKDYPKLQIAAAAAIGKMGKAASRAAPELEKARTKAKTEAVRKAIDEALALVR